MRIKDLLAVESINLSGQASGKDDVLNQMVDLMAKSGKINDVDTYRKGVFAREDESTTGIGEGIAIPHCKSSAVNKPGLAAMVLPNGVDFDALDGEPVNLIFLIGPRRRRRDVAAPHRHPEDIRRRRRARVHSAGPGRHQVRAPPRAGNTVLRRMLLPSRFSRVRLCATP